MDNDAPPQRRVLWRGGKPPCRLSGWGKFRAFRSRYIMSASIIIVMREYIAARVRHEERGFSSECWTWQLALNATGYAHGSPSICKSKRTARVSYEAFVGPIPEGLQLDHLCRNRSCVNPYHLEPVTAAENARRRQWKRTVCLYGHPFEGDNIRVYANGARVCRICNDAWWNAKREMRKAARRKVAA